MNSLRCLVYLSSATRLLSDDDLTGLLRECRRHNEDNAVTGVLVHSEGNFMQMLEGPSQSIEHIMARVRASPLHRGIIELIDAPVSVREFGTWSMAFKQANAQQLFELSTAPWVRSDDHTSGGLELLRKFWDGGYQPAATGTPQ